MADKADEAPRIETTDDLRRFMESTDAALKTWAENKMKAVGYVDAVMGELNTHKVAFHGYCLVQALALLDKQAARIGELEKHLQGDGK